MHSDINVSGLYCIKSATGTTIVNSLFVLYKTYCSILKNVGILIDVDVLNKFIWVDGVRCDR